MTKAKAAVPMSENLTVQSMSEAQAHIRLAAKHSKAVDEQAAASGAIITLAKLIGGELKAWKAQAPAYSRKVKAGSPP